MKKLACKLLILTVVTSVSLLFSGSLQTVTAQDIPAFDRLKTSFEEGRIFHSEFNHRYEDSFTGETEQNEGIIWIGKEQYKIEGSNQVMVVDGEISRVYDGSKNRIIISDYIEEEDDFAPSRMLQGVDDSYSVQESALENGGTEIVLSSSDPFSIFERVTILLDSEGNPTEIRALDQAENILVTRFSGGSFTDAAEDLFTLEHPEDAELIDLRYNTQ